MTTDLAQAGRTLAENEAVIERGLQTFVEVGEALLCIRDGRQYRDAGYSDFETYCRERWGWTRQHASRLIGAAEVTAQLSPIGDSNILPLNEAQARELAPLRDDPLLLQQAWEAAVDDAGGVPTAQQVRAAVAEVQASQDAICGTCGGEFPAPVWECPACEHHWPLHRETCGNCYRSRDGEDEIDEDDGAEEGESLEPTPLAVHFSSESAEWYTPQHIIERVRDVLGGIDLDPCSNSHETPNVPAAVHFTAEDDGLSKAWHGTVYMNPPYGRDIEPWVQKLAQEFAAGRMTEAIALVPARTDTQWFRILAGFPVCFLDGRLKFSGHDNSAPFPSALFYLGWDIAKFGAAFEDIGLIYQRWSR